MCQAVCFKKHNCGRDWLAFYQAYFLFLLGLQLYHIFQASLQSGLSIWLSYSQLNVSGSDVCHSSLTHKKPPTCNSLCSFHIPLTWVRHSYQSWEEGIEDYGATIMDSPCRQRCSLTRNTCFGLLHECNINLLC